jgi:hypothetical protein
MYLLLLFPHSGEEIGKEISYSSRDGSKLGGGLGGRILGGGGGGGRFSKSISIFELPFPPLVLDSVLFKEPVLESRISEGVLAER